MSLDINKLLSESSSPLDALLAQSRNIAKKWDQTGLLEGLAEHDRSGMAVLLENQAKQLVKENSATGTAASAEEWNGVALPLVRKVFGEIAAKEFVSVQPMNLPSGLLFFLDFQYGTAVAPRTVGESVYGDTTSSLAPKDGLYGAGRFGYTINDITASGFSFTSSSLAQSASVNFEISPAGLYEIGVLLTSLSNADKSAVRSFVPSGSGWTTYYPVYTRLSTDQTKVIFIVNQSGSIDKVTYSSQPLTYDRGDFEDKVGQSVTSTGVDLNIPEINIQLRSEPVVAKTRKLKAVWTPELAQDLNAYHSLDAEAELTAILSEHIALEIDLEILDMLLVNAKTTDYWSANVATVWNGTNFASDATLSAQAWTYMTWYQTLGNRMQRVSNIIHQLTLRGGANFAVMSPQVATIVETIPGYTPKTDGNQQSFAMGVTAVGSFQNRFTIYKNPYFSNNVILMGFRGSNFLETGAVYAPYIPLIMTPLVYDPQNFTPRRGVMTRYAKKMVRNEFYGKIIVHGVV